MCDSEGNLLTARDVQYLKQQKAIKNLNISNELRKELSSGVRYSTLNDDAVNSFMSHHTPATSTPAPGSCSRV